MVREGQGRQQKDGGDRGKSDQRKQNTESMIEQWRNGYDEVRPHGLFGNLTPQEFMKNLEAKEGSETGFLTLLVV